MSLSVTRRPEIAQIRVKTPTDAVAKSSINSLHSGRARTRSDNTCQFWGVGLPILANKIPFILNHKPTRYAFSVSVELLFMDSKIHHQAKARAECRNSEYVLL